MTKGEEKIYTRVYTIYIQNKGFYHDEAQKQAEEAVKKFRESTVKLLQ